MFQLILNNNSFIKTSKIFDILIFFQQKFIIIIHELENIKFFYLGYTLIGLIFLIYIINNYNIWTNIFYKDIKNIIKKLLEIGALIATILGTIITAIDYKISNNKKTNSESNSENKINSKKSNITNSFIIYKNYNDK